MKKIALVGCGRISKRHVEAIRDTDEVEITTLCDINEQKVKTLAEELQLPYVCDYTKIKDVDVISVLTPSGDHPRHVAEIAENTDAKYIVCEKPISLTVREADEMFKRVDKAGKVLLPVYQNRYNPLIVMVKELIDSGRLGTVYQFICNALWNRNDDYFTNGWHGTRALDGGVLYTQASHYVDMLHYFFGELASGKGQGGFLRGLEVFDTVSAVMRFQSGVVGSLNATVSVYRQNYETEFTLIAENGTVRLAGTNLNHITHWDVKGMDKPDLDFHLDHIYGKGHNTMYAYIANEQWHKFPSREDVLSGIHLMEKLSY